ncbi:MAG: AAA family ATPase [Thermosediminibacteraceae bacterium]|nr:AAA family ATPase [Thermosediminibacteraceae bacterium]
MELILTGLRIKNFRSLDDINIEFPLEKPNLRVFIGKNDTGKSNLLRAIKLVLSGEKPENEDFRNQGRPIEIEATFVNAEDPEGNRYTCHYSYSPAAGRRGPSLNWEPTSPGVQFEPIYIPSLRDITVELKYGDRNKNVFSQLITPLLEDESLEQIKEGLRSRVSEIVEGLSQQISSKVKNMLGREDIFLSFSPEVKTSYDFSNIQTGFGQLRCHGHGTQSCVVMAIFDVYAEQARSEGKKIKNLYFLIEEPENHLHPELQRAMAWRLRQLSEEYQVFVSTHSPFILDRSLGAPCYMVSFNSEKGTQVSYVDTSREFYYLITELGVRPSDLLQHDAILLVEGLSDAAILREWLQLYSKSTGRNLADRVLVLPLGGSSLYNDRNQIILSELKKNVEIWVLIDSDRENEEEDFGSQNANAKREFKNLCQSLGIPLTVTHRREIENYFSLHAIKAIFKEIDPNLLGPFSDIKELLKPLGYNQTRDGPKIASQMKPEDLRGTDIWELFDGISKKLYG